MRHFLFEDKEYRINPQFRRRRLREQDPSRALAQLLRELRPGKKRRAFISTGRIRGTDTRQKCVVKMQYSSSAAAHRDQLEHYLVREGTDIDGGQARLYGSDIDEYRKNMADRNFRIFLSPQSKQVDLKDLAQRFIIKLEYATGYKLHWQGANHYNTAHPHAHLLINGTDRAGKEVEIPRDIVKTFMREYARDICTSQLGSRSLQEIALEKEKELTARRFTRLDEKIKESCGGTFKVNLSGIANPLQRERLLARVEALRKMKFCVYKDGHYRLSPRWEEDLRANGRYNTFLKARSELKYSDAASLKVFSGSGGQITGKVTKVYRTDEDASDNHAVILEGVDGKAYFVPLFKTPEVRNAKRERDVSGDPDGKGTQHKRELLREGELVSIKTYENQRGRLTPLIYKKETAQVLSEIQKNGYRGKLAAELLNRRADKKQKSIEKN